MHITVLPQESTDYWLSLDKNKKVSKGIYVDATFGEGGHTERALKITQKAKDIIFVGLDWDKDQIKKAQQKYAKEIKNKRLWLFADNFKNINKIISSLNKKIKTKLPVRGVLFDLGMCSNQLEENRGFSFQEEKACLDMRFDQKNNPLTAKQILNDWPAEKIAQILKDQGEEKHSWKIAQALLEARKEGIAIEKVQDLLKILEKTVGKAYRKYRLHFATRTFQALRMTVNKETENISQGLISALDVLSKSGRLVAISFHSGEDRLVKNFFRGESRDCLCPPILPICQCNHQKKLKIITRKPIQPTAQEIDSNPRSRSAKMRVAEKI